MRNTSEKRFGIHIPFGLASPHRFNCENAVIPESNVDWSFLSLGALLRNGRKKVENKGTIKLIPAGALLNRCGVYAEPSDSKLVALLKSLTLY